MPLLFIRTALLAWLLALAPVLVTVAVFVAPDAHSAHATDDEDDDDDDDDDGGSGGGGSIGGPGEPFVIDAQPRRRAAPARQAAAPPPIAASDEVVLRGLDDALRVRLIEAGYEILGEIGDDLALLGLPDGLGVDDALVAVQQLSPGSIVAANSYYRTQQAEATVCEAQICESWSAVALSAAGAACLVATEIGVVDTGVNLEHDMLAGADIVVERFGTGNGADKSGERHGTALVAMFAGAPYSRVPGMVPTATVRVADPFLRAGGDERSDTFALVAALDSLIAAKVAIISLSLAGPPNALLEDAVTRATAASIPLVAAVGNDGPQAAPLFPAGYEPVIAVTAVDARSRIYRRAVQGDHVDFAAPGVGIATAASISGVRPQTGTSFAVPFVTVAALAELQRLPGIEVTALVAALASRASDLGEPGRDPVFGWGLVQVGDACTDPASPLGAGEAPVPAGGS